MPEKFDDTPFLKPGGVYCSQCVGKKGDHAPGCIVIDEKRSQQRRAEEQ